MALHSAHFNFTNISEGDPLFDMELQRLQTLYHRYYTWGSTSTLGPLGPDYESENQPGTEEAGTHLYLLPFGGDTLPIRLHERRESDGESEAGSHYDLSPIIDNPSPGRAQYHRDNSDTE